MTDDPGGKWREGRVAVRSPSVTGIRIPAVRRRRHDITARAEYVERNLFAEWSDQPPNPPTIGGEVQVPPTLAARRRFERGGKVE